MSQDNQVWGGVGADVLSFRNVAATKVWGGDGGANYISVVGSASVPATDVDITGGDQSDEIVLHHVSYSSVAGGAGDDKVTVDGTDNFLYGGYGAGDVLVYRSDQNQAGIEEFETLTEASAAGAPPDADAVQGGGSFDSKGKKKCGKKCKKCKKKCRDKPTKKKQKKCAKKC